MTNYLYKNFLFLALVTVSSSISSESKETMEGYWLTSQSIVQVKNCDKNLCATIEHLFVDDDIDPKSIMDSNNKNLALKTFIKKNNQLAKNYNIKNLMISISSINSFFDFFFNLPNFIK